MKLFISTLTQVVQGFDDKMAQAAATELKICKKQVALMDHL